MSQQINLVLPELRPRFDWLGLPVVAAAAIVGLLLVGGFYGYQKMQLAKLAGTGTYAQGATDRPAAAGAGIWSGDRGASG
jgi:hypothetical protein